MKTISTILKFSIYSLLDWNQVRWGKSIWQKLKPFGKILLVLYAVVALSAGYWLVLKEFAFIFRLPMINGVVIKVIITSAFLALLFLNIAGSGQMIFNGKEMPRWFVLPVKNRDVLIGKTAILYIGNLLLLLLIMAPLFVTMSNVGKFPPQNLAMGVATVLIMPVLPILLGILINLAITLLIVRRISLKNRKTVAIVLSILLFVGIFFVSFSMSDLSSFARAFNIMRQLSRLNIFSDLVSSIILQADWTAMALLFAVSIAGLVAYLLFFSPRLNSIYEKLNSNTRSNTKTEVGFRQWSPIQALMLKDLNMYFTNAGVAVNLFSGVIMVLFMNIFLLFRKDLLEIMFPALEMANFSPVIIAIIMLSVLFAMTMITPSTLSLEGVHFQMLKNYPVTTRTIFFYKALLAVIVNWIALLVNIPLIIYNFNLSFQESILTIFVSIGSSLFFPLMGLIINLWFPKFDWTNPVACVKQSFATFLSIMAGMLISFAPVLLINLPIPLFTGLILLGILFFLLALGMWGYLMKWGVNRFSRL